MARVLLFLACAWLASTERVAVNPIRKVVTMLQKMSEKVTKEGEKEKDLFKKFMCYCKDNGGTLKESIAAAEAKAPTLGTDIEEAQASKATLEGELKEAQSDRTAAKEAMAEATSIREKEAAAYAAEKAKYDSFITAIGKAVEALEKGMAGSFLQTNNARVLQQLATGVQDLADSEREVLASFLSGSHSTRYAPQGGEVTGILKQMGDEMTASLSEATATEEAGITSYKELMTAKKKEVVALGRSIESKMTRIGELGVTIEELKNDLGQTAAALEEDKKFLAELEKGCSKKSAEWEERSKTRADELQALSETIKVLNDDDALELFKKTLPSPSSSSFVQVEVSAEALRAQALAEVRKARHAAGADRARISLIATALHGRSVDFSKVITMIDDMTALLKKEQGDDKAKKEFCATEFDTSDDKKKALEQKVADEDTAISTAKDAIATLTDEIAALKAGIAQLDKAVATATATRKAEHADYTELMSTNTASKELLGFAKNLLNRFYNPKLYKAPEKQELSSEDRIVVNMGGTVTTTLPGGIAGTGIEPSFAQIDAQGGVTVLAQVSAHSQEVNADTVAPPPPPETFGAYTKKSEETGGVIAMMDLLIKDLEREMTEAETSEKDAQADYQEMMKDAAEKRSMDSKTLVGKESVKSDTEANLAAHKEEKASATKELGATLEYIGSLHADCDWLLKYFDVRKEARDGEIESLANAKAVLSGADYSLVQTNARGLRRRWT